MQLEADRDSLIGLLPFYHIYGMIVVQFGSIIQGGKLVVVPGFQPDMFMNAIQQHRVGITMICHTLFCVHYYPMYTEIKIKRSETAIEY